MIDKVLDVRLRQCSQDASIAAQAKMTYSSIPVEWKQVQDLATKQEIVGRRQR